MEKVRDMILFIGGPVDWRAWETWMGDIGYCGRGCVTDVDWERLRELRVWRKRKISWSDYGQTNRQTDRQMDRISTCRLNPCKRLSKNVWHLKLKYIFTHWREYCRTHISLAPPLDFWPSHIFRGEHTISTISLFLYPQIWLLAIFQQSRSKFPLSNLYNGFF